MTTEDRLLRAVLMNPEDDLPRLVYADYLDEVGGTREAQRARFIRTQCADHRRFVTVGFKTERLQWSWSTLSSRMPRQHPWKRTAQHISRDGLSYPSELHLTSATLRRGFVDTLRVPTWQFPDHIFSRQPVTEIAVASRRALWREAANGLLETEYGWMEQVYNCDPTIRHSIPSTIFKRLSGRSWATYWKIYDTQDLATADLSNAIVNHYRELADLPPITPAAGSTSTATAIP